MRIGLLGGIPPALGGGGLELQQQRTADALRGRGHTAEHVACAPAGASWDVLHAFGGEGDVQHVLQHWTRAPAPLVLSPVVVASPGRDEAALALLSRLPGRSTAAKLRRVALERADLVVALTQYERRIVRRVIGARTEVVVVPNGVDPVAPAPASGRRPGYALLLGSVTARKRTAEALAALAGTGPVVIAGGFGDGDRAAFEAQVHRTGAEWLGHVAGADAVARLLLDAAALVHVSRAEVQSLAVLEALALGTPAILSDLPSHRELARSHPNHVHLVKRLEDLPAALSRARSTPPPGPAAIPTWDQVAAQLEARYEALAGRPASTSA